MATNNVHIILDSLKNIDAETSPDILGRIFEACLKITEIIETTSISSNEPEFKNILTISIKYLERCTRMVNELDLFSSNEAIEEVETSSIKYLMLPVLLGYFSLGLQSTDYSERLKYLETAEVYFKDFLLRCKNYELSKKELVNNYEDDLLEDCGDENYVIPSQSLAEAVAQREQKIKVYRLEKELKDRENELKSFLNREDADEFIREYYLVLIERWILTAVQELENIRSEKLILGGRIRNKREYSNGVSTQTSYVKPLKPIIITKNEVQKKVFGFGYPSLPIMTIDDFYRQRFEKMVKEHKNNSAKSMQGPSPPNKEDEEIEKEQLLDKDDPQALQYARGWDDWKDENPRGSGNRHNKG